MRDTIRKWIGFFCLMLVVSMGAKAADVTFKASAPQAVVVGEQFRLSFTVNAEGKDLRVQEMPDFDGGYVMCGLTGSGEMFSVRDPWGIRPAFWYQDDEIIALASERPVLQTTFDLECDDIQELDPGCALIVHKDGKSQIKRILDQRGDAKCSFERIYFSRGSDRDIYQERKKLGEQLTPSILKSVDYDTEHTVFSFIPNTAEVAFYGMLGGFKRYINDQKIKAFQKLDHKPSYEELQEILHQYVRSEKIAWKDIKLRTFITEGASRNDLASHVYDVTYESSCSSVIFVISPSCIVSG